MNEIIRLLIALSLPLWLMVGLPVGWLRNRRIFAALAIIYLAAVAIYLATNGTPYVPLLLFILSNAAMIAAGIIFRKSPSDKGAGDNRRCL